MWKQCKGNEGAMVGCNDGVLGRWGCDEDAAQASGRLHTGCGAEQRPSPPGAMGLICAGRHVWQAVVGAGGHEMSAFVGLLVAMKDTIQSNCIHCPQLSYGRAVIHNTIVASSLRTPVLPPKTPGSKDCPTRTNQRAPLLPRILSFSLARPHSLLPCIP